MANYQSILVALNLGARNHSTLLINKALELAKPSHVHIVHIEEHPVTGLGDLTGRNHATNEAQIRQRVFPELSALASDVSIPVANLHIAFGDPAIEIHAAARKLDCDLLVIGHHGSSKFTSLLRTTASDIVSESKIDTLVVRLDD